MQLQTQKLKQDFITKSAQNLVQQNQQHFEVLKRETWRNEEKTKIKENNRMKSNCKLTQQEKIH